MHSTCHHVCRGEEPLAAGTDLKGSTASSSLVIAYIYYLRAAFSRNLPPHGVRQAASSQVSGPESAMLGLTELDSAGTLMLTNTPSVCRDNSPASEQTNTRSPLSSTRGSPQAPLAPRRNYYADYTTLDAGT